jgi:hypothetical protein
MLKPYTFLRGWAYREFTHAGGKPNAGRMGEKEFLTILEAAEYFGWSVETLRKRMADGVLRRGVHWFKREGEISVRFDRAACAAWIREGKGEGEERKLVVVPMARRYNVKSVDR